MPSLRPLDRLTRALRPVLSPLAQPLTTPLRPADFLSLVDPLASPRQLRGVVTSVVPETDDTTTIHFRPGRGWDSHMAGQWARVGVEIDGVRHWRSYSLSSAAGEDPAITVHAEGLVSNALVRDTHVGDVLHLDVPQGDFVLPEHPRPLLMLTAGSGLTPVMSMVRTLVGHRDDADVVLVHSSRTRADALFADELADLAERHPGLRVVHWHTGERGRIDLTSTRDLDEVCPDWRSRAAYACGPADLLDAAERLWHDADAAHHLTIERFAPVVLEGQGGEGGVVTFLRSDKEVEVDGDTTLLDAAEQAGVMMPSGCRMGICHTCLTPLRAGKVRDLRTGEVHGEEGETIQTCVSAPAGPCHLEI
ncbi:ferredoxin reductase [Arsenicicoccus sp. oral taxon 190]|uniref:ferredoxin reductase n=1 Tax=Arsenicicoccus sp. oral taxon 190 TaxID=1658671 RepID=UPI00067A30B6|nr:ferredoxin reductase [Arsenicicoccus sp. oral taxon 190]AKT50127.1 oxidoreductase [Arsenicicoccus sp. oral taxon 190]